MNLFAAGGGGDDPLAGAAAGEGQAVQAAVEARAPAEALAALDLFPVTVL